VDPRHFGRKTIFIENWDGSAVILEARPQSPNKVSEPTISTPACLVFPQHDQQLGAVQDLETAVNSYVK
jgi:hypothetical protein